jgi:hypothetical protein
VFFTTNQISQIFLKPKVSFHIPIKPHPVKIYFEVASQVMMSPQSTYNNPECIEPQHLEFSIQHGYELTIIETHIFRPDFESFLYAPENAEFGQAVGRRL